MLLKDKVVLITGAGRGLGKSTALLFGRHGAKVAVVARTKREIDEVAKKIVELDGEAIAIQTDIAEENQVQNLFSQIDKMFGRIDILLNNAGIGIYGPVEELKSDDLERMLAVNLKGTIYCSKAAFIRMKKTGSGHIVNVISTSGKIGRFGESGYCASKFGVAGFSESLKLEGKKHGIAVISFYPGGMNTTFWDKVKNKPDTSKFMDPDEVASVLLQVVLDYKTLMIGDITIQRSS